MKNKEIKIIFKPIFVSESEEQKRMDELAEVVYELYCQYQLEKSVHKSLNENLTKETSL